jgi:hypothetical protein
VFCEVRITILHIDRLLRSARASGRFALPDLSSRYAPRDATVTLEHYRRFDEQEPTTGEGGESECSIARHSDQIASCRCR